MTDDTLIEPTPERARHDPVVRMEHQIADEQGSPSLPWVLRDLFVRWADRGLISREELAAAEEFRTLFHVAQLDALRASDPARLPIPGKAPVEGWRVEQARRQVRAIMDRLAPREASAVWHIVGLEWSLRQWCEMRRGHPADPVGIEAARDILIAGIKALPR